MAGPQSEDFILINVNDNNGKVQQAVMFDSAQLTHSIIQQSNQNLAESIDGWSEITAPSVQSINSNQKQAVKDSVSTFSMFGGTFLHNPAPTIPKNTEGSDKGYYLINPSASQENTEGPMLSSYDVSTENEDISNHNQMPLPSSPLSSIPAPPNHAERNSIGSVSSRVPFSWAEVTKIQPAFHNDPDNQTPKVFNQTPKIRTRYRRKVKDNGIKINNSNSPRPPPSASAQTDNTCIDNEEYPMGAIPESDPYATKADLGRRVRRSGKRGSRLKYPNGRKGTKKNWRKRNQSK